MGPFSSNSNRIRAAGKFFRLGQRKWFAQGFAYGPFPPNSAGEFLPEPEQLRADFRHMRELGARAIRVYHVPTRDVLDEALAHDLRVMIDVPWEKHRCFFEDWQCRREAQEAVCRVAREFGDHPGLFALSVGNEIPSDVVRYYGGVRVARFIDELIDTAKQEAPESLVTYVNYPTTEFLRPTRADFCCFNVYLNDAEDFGSYLDRLQHVAGPTPLVLGECGVDAIRNREDEQAQLVTRSIEKARRHGLAGSFVFTYTDEWYRGGRLVEDWAFGATRRDRSERPLAASLRNTWQPPGHADCDDLPRVSVVVCTYNGSATLDDCLRSLMELEYPDYEVLLVDDGSTDTTPRIAARYPQVTCLRQPNRGLSAARNVGAEAASGQIVAYTDDDCIADEDWLLHLVRAMRDQKVEAIGGPNIPPPENSWIAQCVAVSPGGPSHVMLDDHRAEHVPGCNMAFRRDVLLSIGGFDPQFRQAGDDVDLCWRLIDAGYDIGFASGAMVWHRRRGTVKAYLKQQKGYGRAEALVHFKHPQRSSFYGRSRWQGVIYGPIPSLPGTQPLIYHGRFGQALFQTLYQRNEGSIWAASLALEWHFVAALMALLGLLWPPMAIVALAMWILTAGVATVAARRISLPPGNPWWCRPLVGYLHVAQPVVRGWHRIWGRVRRRRAGNPIVAEWREASRQRRGVEASLYWDDRHGRGREQLLDAVIAQASDDGWLGDFGDAWASWDMRLIGDCWHDITVRTATEELGQSRRFTRARLTVTPTGLGWVTTTVALVWTTMAIASETYWAIAVGLVAASAVLVGSIRSRLRCLHAASVLFSKAGTRAHLGSETPQAEFVDLPPLLDTHEVECIEGCNEIRPDSQLVIQP